MKSLKWLITVFVLIFISNNAFAQIALIDSTYIAKSPNSQLGLFFDQEQRFRGVSSTGSFNINLNPNNGAIGSRWNLTSNNSGNLGTTTFATGAIAQGPEMNWALAGLANSDSLGSSAVQALGDVTVTGLLFFSSDENLKTNIREINSVLDDIKRLPAKSYQYQNEAIGNVLPKGTQFGFLAQEVGEVFPHLTTTKYATTVNEQNELNENLVPFEAVNYIGMIPILWKGIQEQQSIIDKKQIQINNLETRLEKLERMMLELAGQEIGSISNKKNRQVKLNQNAPNPFTDFTTINYFIPENEKFANLIVFDMYGQQLQIHELNIGEESSVEISLAGYASGIYPYSIFSKEGFVSKQMIYKK